MKTYPEEVLNFKSLIGFCPCAEPRKIFISYIDVNGKEIRRVRIGKRVSETCKYCGKLWSEH